MDVLAREGYVFDVPNIHATVKTLATEIESGTRRYLLLPCNVNEGSVGEENAASQKKNT